MVPNFRPGFIALLVGSLGTFDAVIATVTGPVIGEPGEVQI